MKPVMLKKYVNAGLVLQSGNWYSVVIDGSVEKLGQQVAATEKLKELISEGKVANLGKALSTVIEPKKADKPEAASVLNSNLEKIPELPENDAEMYSSLAGELGDIESAKEGGRFRVFVRGVDSRLAKHPVIVKCPYVFRHSEIKRNVKSGTRTLNKGWTVLSKKLISNDPRTNLPWLTVARDDSPDEDSFRVGVNVLCFAEKKQFKNKKGKQNIINMLATTTMLDQRIEKSENLAKLSKTDAEKSMEGYAGANAIERTQTKEYLQDSKGLTSAQAKEVISGLDNIGDGEDIDTKVASINALVNSGQIGRGLKTAETVTIDEI